MNARRRETALQNWLSGSTFSPLRFLSFCLFPPSCTRRGQLSAAVTTPGNAQPAPGPVWTQQGIVLILHAGCFAGDSSGHRHNGGLLGVCYRLLRGCRVAYQCSQLSDVFSQAATAQHCQPCALDAATLPKPGLSLPLTWEKHECFQVQGWIVFHLCAVHVYKCLIYCTFTSYH